MTSDQERSATMTRVVVASTIALSFISFWRAAAIVLSDLASSAYYVGGIAETAIGKSAPWFILAIMLFSYAVRAVYIEGCTMFVRGGVYRVVHAAMGSSMAKVAVSALMFDYVLTGPISGVSAGLYLGGLINEIGQHLQIRGMHVDPPLFAATFAIAATLYFWRNNVKGIHESSTKALWIMQVTTVMVGILIVWCVATILSKGYQPVPFPSPGNMKFGPDALGWLEGTFAPSLTAVAVLIGLGHSLLAMSGEESLAQVNREIAHPKLKNLERAGLVIFIYSMVFTSLVSFFAVMLIPDSDRGGFLDNLIGGLSMYLVGPVSLRLLFHVFVVAVGTLILSGAVNTAIIGSNGVLNRVAEDGVLPDWFRQPHRKFGTTHRLINLIVGLQLLTIVISRGDVLLLGEAYAFGVVWSFAMKALSVLVLRYRRPEAREWKVPGNFTLFGREWPVGLLLITLSLFALATINLLTKKIATIFGIAFTLTFLFLFLASEAYNRRRHKGERSDLEKFRLQTGDEVTLDHLKVRPGSVLVSVRNPNSLKHLDKVLHRTDTRKMDIVVLSVATLEQKGAEYQLDMDQIFSSRQSELFTKVVASAEKAGKHVELLVVPGGDPRAVIVRIAAQLKSSRIVAGQSSIATADEQGRLVGEAWEKLPEPRPSVSLEVVTADGASRFYNLGPHPPRLWPEDVDRVHRLWLTLSPKFGAKLHHRDVVGVALRQLEQQLEEGDAEALHEAIRKELDQDHSKDG